MIENRDLVVYKRSKQRAQIVTVSGSKGGIGKTFFSVNFGVELKNRGYRVLIFDADINLSNVNLFLDIDESGRFLDFLENRIPINDVIQRGVGGVDALYVGNDLKGILTIQDEDFKKIAVGLSQIETDYDFIIIDTQAGLNNLNLQLILYSDRNILITNPEVTALVDLYKVIKIASQKRRGLHFEIVINKSYGAQSAARIFWKISNTVNQFHIKTALSFLGYIVEDSKRVIESIQKRVPIVLLHETGSIKECLRMITNTFLRKVKVKRKIPFFYGLLGR